MKEIIVYLDDYKYGGNGKYDKLYLDFRTMRDYNYFIEGLQLEGTSGTYIEIDGYHSPKRLVRGAYYSLNTAMLRKLSPNGYEESHVLAWSYDFSGYDGPNDKSFHLLQTHEPLDPDELIARVHNRLMTFDELMSPNDLEFRVNDVSHANWNEVRQDEKVRIVYDIGAPITASKNKVRQYITQYAAQYTTDHPCLVLSHWDKDHYLCLLGMSDDEIKSFSKVVCVDKMKSVTSQRLFQKLLDVLGESNVYCYDPRSRTIGSSYPLMHAEFSNDVIRVYTGESSRNTNYTGVVISVNGDRGNVIFTGDCLPAQANEVLQDLYHKQALSKDHYLVVPHHGGDFKSKPVYKTYQIPHGINAKEAIISVDEMNNTYGHPDQDMLNWLGKVATWAIVRTDKVGTVEVKLV